MRALNDRYLTALRRRLDQFRSWRLSAPARLARRSSRGSSPAACARGPTPQLRWTDV